MCQSMFLVNSVDFSFTKINNVSVLLVRRISLFCSLIRSILSLTALVACFLLCISNGFLNGLRSFKIQISVFRSLSLAHAIFLNKCIIIVRSPTHSCRFTIMQLQYRNFSLLFFTCANFNICIFFLILLFVAVQLSLFHQSKFIQIVNVFFPRFRIHTHNPASKFTKLNSL